MSDLLQPEIGSEERAALIRKGNACYNKGDIEQAKRLFLQTGYTGGMIRIADYYYSQRKPAAALLLYRAAGCHNKVEELYGQIVAVIRTLLAQDGDGRGVPAPADRDEGKDFPKTP
jgi:hypothetical protein